MELEILVVLMVVFNGGRRPETHGVVEIFRIILGIQVEATCLAVFSLLNTYVIDSLMMEHVVSPTMLLFCNRLLLTFLGGFYV